MTKRRIGSLEIWRDLPGFEGIYQVSDHGQVRSLDRKMLQIRKGKPVIVRRKGVTLKSGADSLGYARVLLQGEKITRRVHQLVLLTFIGPQPPGTECRHLDGDRSNNHLSNLKYGSNRKNQYDRLDHGTHRLGNTHQNSKYTSENVLLMRLMRHRGHSVNEIIARFDISQAHASNITLYKEWLPERGIKYLNRMAKSSTRRSQEFKRVKNEVLTLLCDPALPNREKLINRLLRAVS